MKLFIIPSWYPTQIHPGSGSFFQDRAILINQTKIDKVFVKGKMASLIYKKISNSKKGKILRNKSEIDDLIRNDIKNNDYLMIKASLATGFNKIVNEIKGLN